MNFSDYCFNVISFMQSSCIHSQQMNHVRKKIEHLLIKFYTTQGKYTKTENKDCYQETRIDLTNVKNVDIRNLNKTIMSTTMIKKYISMKNMHNFLQMVFFWNTKSCLSLLIIAHTFHDTVFSQVEVRLWKKWSELRIRGGRWRRRVV